MIVLSDREISNAHGTGVLLKNILITIGNEENIVICKSIDSTPDPEITHYKFVDHGLFNGSRFEKQMMSTYWGAVLYNLYQRPNLSEIPFQKHDTVIITVYHFDTLWVALKIFRIFPNKKYILFMMDSFIDFSSTSEGKMNQMVFKALAKNISTRLAISSRLSKVLSGISGCKFRTFFGPRVVKWTEVNEFQLCKKENKICLVGNVWVPSVLPKVNSELKKANQFVYWITNQNTFENFKRKYDLTNFVFGGSFTSDEVSKEISRYKFGLILYGLDVKADDPYNKGLQDFSIPSKTIDYFLAGVTPIYYGPDDTACKDFLEANKVGLIIKPDNLGGFFEDLSSLDNGLNIARINDLLRNSSTQAFCNLIK